MKDIEIIKEYFGMTTFEAKNYLKITNTKTIEAIKKSFESNAKKVFYED